MTIEIDTSPKALRKWATLGCPRDFSPRFWHELQDLLNSLAAEKEDLSAYYVSRPYLDGSMAVCRRDSGLVVHKFRLNGVPQPAYRPTAAEVPLPEPRAIVKYLETGGNAGIATRIVEKDDPALERLRAGDGLFTAEQMRTYAQAVVAAGCKAARQTFAVTKGLPAAAKYAKMHGHAVTEEWCRGWDAAVLAAQKGAT